MVLEYRQLTLVSHKNPTGINVYWAIRPFKMVYHIKVIWITRNTHRFYKKLSTYNYLQSVC